MLELNTVIQGDCLELMHDIPDGSVDMVLCDPPYGMKFQSGHRNIKHEKIINDDSLSWLPEWVYQTKRVMARGCHFYCFCSWHNIDIFKQEILRIIPIKNVLVWYKNNHGSGDLTADYAPQHELIIFCNPDRKPLNNGRDSNIIKSKKTQNNLHPTEKPVSMYEYLIQKSTLVNETVLDCFAGSFTTLEACYNTKRNAICIEKEAKYCEIGRKRQEDFTAQGRLF